MAQKPPTLSPLFLNQFEVDESVPFRRYLNRLEVEIGDEDYSLLKRIERLDFQPDENFFSPLSEITDRILTSTQNNYNRELLKKQQVRIYLDNSSYSIYYRLPDFTLLFLATWRQSVLEKFFHAPPAENTGWHPCGQSLPDFEVRYNHDLSGGVLLLRHLHEEARHQKPLMTASHGPYDPHTLEVTLYFLRTGKAGSAIINLGFSGREPLTDENVKRLESWGLPLNPSNIDVIYPYTDQKGHPCCYKVEENLPNLIEMMSLELPELVIDVHGCVGTYKEDKRVVVGLGGLPPFLNPEALGSLLKEEGIMFLQPKSLFKQGLSIIRDLSDEMYVQFCASTNLCYNFALLGGMQLIGFQVIPESDIDNLLDGEERAFLPKENLRWIPGAGANAIQRKAAQRINPMSLCLHVEIPTTIRKKMVLKLRSLEIEASLDSSSL